MSPQPKVSVVMPVYNAARWLPLTFDSLENQTYGNVEWILVDDGSADGSADLCSRWCSVDPSRRHLVRKENGGASSARNAGLDHATGDYVLFWDCDDEQDPDAIDKMVASVDGSNEVAVCAIRRALPDGSYHGLFACERHEATPEGALAEWLRGGIYRTLPEARPSSPSCRERHQVRGGRHQRGCSLDRRGFRRLRCG